jgi:hypothetical protein
MSNGLQPFSDDLKDNPPRVISASKLDGNFNACMPAQRGFLRLLALSYDRKGWYCDFPNPPNGTVVLGAINGIVQWIPTQGCEEAEE